MLCKRAQVRREGAYSILGLGLGCLLALGYLDDDDVLQALEVYVAREPAG